MQSMAHSFLVFDFGANEEAAQQARHRIDGWRQGFRLDKKLQVKFDRKEAEAVEETKPPAETPVAASSKAEKPHAKGKSKPPAKSKSKNEPAEEKQTAAPDTGQIRLIVRLDFSDHEKLSHQRWIDRIPTEEPFKSASPKVVRVGEPEFKTTSALFDSLN
jgi:beta-lactam-binding protein with PASTA domain